MEVGEGGVAREDESLEGWVHAGSLHLAPVGLGDIIIDQHQGGSGIGDCRTTGAVGLDRAIADGKTARCKLPEPVRAVDRGICQITFELGLVDPAKLVCTDFGMSKVGGEDWLREGRLDVIEKGSLFLGLYRVDRAKAESKKTIRVRIQDEAVGDVRGKLNGLICH